MVVLGVLSVKWGQLIHLYLFHQPFSSPAVFQAPKVGRYGHTPEADGTSPVSDSPPQTRLGPSALPLCLSHFSVEKLDLPYIISVNLFPGNLCREQPMLTNPPGTTSAWALGGGRSLYVISKPKAFSSYVTWLTKNFFLE